MTKQVKTERGLHPLQRASSYQALEWQGNCLTTLHVPPQGCDSKGIDRLLRCRGRSLRGTDRERCRLLVYRSDEPCHPPRSRHEPDRVPQAGARRATAGMTATRRPSSRSTRVLRRAWQRENAAQAPNRPYSGASQFSIRSPPIRPKSARLLVARTRAFSIAVAAIRMSASGINKPRPWRSE